MGEDEPPFSFIGRPIDPGFAIRFMCIPPGAERLFRGVDWADALVVVEHGILELVAPGGARARFGQGNVLSLAGASLRAIRNSGSDTVLLSTARRRGSEPPKTPMRSPPASTAPPASEPRIDSDHRYVPLARGA